MNYNDFYTTILSTQHHDSNLDKEVDVAKYLANLKIKIMAVVTLTIVSPRGRHDQDMTMLM